MAVCTSCGREADEATKFCTNCGQSLAKAAPAPVSPARTCPSCSAPVEPSSAFCTNCGQGLFRKDSSAGEHSTCGRACEHCACRCAVATTNVSTVNTTQRTFVFRFYVSTASAAGRQKIRIGGPGPAVGDRCSRLRRVVFLGCGDNCGLQPAGRTGLS
jgi:hypothetical protein